MKIQSITQEQVDALKKPIDRLGQFGDRLDRGGSSARETRRLLVEILEAEVFADGINQFPDLRLRLIKTLRKTGSVEKAALPSLIEALKEHPWVVEEDRDIKVEAAGALGEMGEDAKGAVPELISALQNRRFPGGPVRTWPKNINEINDIKRSAAKALGQIGLNTPDVLVALQEARNNPEISEEATAAITSINEKSKTSDRKR